MSKRELNAARAELTELLRLLAHTFPSGKKKNPNDLWQQVRRLADLAQWLDDLSDPTPARPLVSTAAGNADPDVTHTGRGGKSADQSVFPGVRLLDRPGDRNLYHQGRKHADELDRLAKRLEKMINQTAEWVRGLDRDPVHVPTHERDRCAGCNELLATTWRYCPYCKEPTS